MDDQTRTELEFIVREYSVVTQRLVEMFMKAEDGDIPASILAALDQLASAINVSWED